MKIIFLILLPCTLFAQSKKEIRKNGIKSLTEIVISNESGKEDRHKDKVQRFDKEGNTIEKLEFDKTGKLKEKRTFKYDSEGEKIEELTYNTKNELLEKSVYKYDAKGLCKEKKTYNAQGKLIQTKQYQI